MPAARRALHRRGQPVAIQSPARKQFGHGDTAAGRAASIPGGTVNVARTSFTSAAFSSFASATAGKNSAKFAHRQLNRLFAARAPQMPAMR